MKKVGFVVGPALGHVSRLYVVAQQLLAILDVQIIFVSPGSGPYLEGLVGGSFEAISVPIPGEAKSAPYEAFASGVEEVFRSNQFDLIVHDLDPLRWISTIRFPDCPRVNVTNVFLTRLAQARSVQVTRYEKIGDAINRHRAEKGLPKFTSAYDSYEADRVLLADPLPLIARYGDLPGHYRACGSCTWSLAGDVPAALSGVTDALILSMGSTGRGTFDVELLKHIIRWTGCNSSIYVGNKMREMRELDFFDYVYDWLPLVKVLDMARVIGSQGGTGSTYQALSKGIPVIVFPAHQNHQILGGILEDMGVGVCIDMGAPQQKIDVLDFVTLSANAVVLAGEIERQDGAAEIATQIAQLL